MGVVSKGMYFYQEVGKMGNQEEKLKLSESSHGERSSPSLCLREQRGAGKGHPNTELWAVEGGFDGSSGPGEN